MALYCLFVMSSRREIVLSSLTLGDAVVVAGRLLRARLCCRWRLPLLPELRTRKGEWGLFRFRVQLRNRASFVDVYAVAPSGRTT
jgi:hypothetical protein